MVHPGKVASYIAGPLALISLILALLIKHRWTDLRESLGYTMLALWVLGPPVWFWVEWVFLSRDQDGQRLKHTHDLARNIWLALVVVLAAILKIEWPPRG